MRGEVTVDSMPGSGSVFSLWLPSAAPSSGAELLIEEAPPAAALAPPRTRGLAEVGDAIIREMESLLDTFVSRLRREPLMPAAPTLRYSQLVDHSGSLLTDIAAALVTLDESEGAPSTLLVDASDIQRFVADRHGLQRARLGWSVEALARESVILFEEVERTVRRCFGDAKYAAQRDEAIGVIGRFLEQAAEASRRALERASNQTRHG
jgi:hypothetical protein